MTWPLGQHKYGSYQWLLREVGDALLGGNADETAWDYEAFGRIDSIVQRGVRQFYSPPPIPGERNGHRWSFLFPTLTLTLEEDEDTYDLPDGFEGFTGPLTFDSGQSTFGYAVTITGENRIAQLQGTAVSSSIPVYAAVRVKPHDGELGTQHEIVFYPAPDEDYEISAPCRISPLDLSEEHNMPCGGVQHAETIRAACLAAAAPGDQVAQSAFLQRLVASVGHDRLTSVAENLGRNIDLSDAVYADEYRDQTNVVTYNGVAY